MREWLAGVVGENLAPVVSVILAAAVVLLLALVLIGLAKRVFSGTGGIGSRSRAPRLAVLDVTAIDPKRKLVLVRRDEVEHLLLIGGQNDLVVEPTILRGQVPRRPRVEGAAPRREPELTRDAPAERVAPPVPPRRVPVVAAPDPSAPVVDLPPGEPVSPVSSSPRETTASRQRAAARAEPPVEAPSPPRLDDATRPVEPNGLFPIGATPARDEDAILAAKPRRDVDMPPAGAMPSSPEADRMPGQDAARRPSADGRPAWMMASPEPEDRSPPAPDLVARSTRAAVPVGDARARESEDGGPAVFASVFPPPVPERPVVTPPPVAPPVRSEPSNSLASPAPPPSALVGPSPPSPAAPRSMATPTLPVPVRAPTLPLPPLQRTEPSPPAAPAAVARSLWSPASQAPGPARAPDPVPVDRTRTPPGSNDQVPATTASFDEAPKPGAPPVADARPEPVRAAPATVRSGPAPFPAAPGVGVPASAGGGAASATTAPAPSPEPDEGRQPLSVRSFATTIQERRNAPPLPAEPRPVPTTPMAAPVLPPLTTAVAPAIAAAKARGADQPSMQPAAASAPKDPAGFPDERDASTADAPPLTLEEEMERLLHDFTIDVSDRR